VFMFLRHAFFPFLDVFDGAILLYAVWSQVQS